VKAGGWGWGKIHLKTNCLSGTAGNRGNLGSVECQWHLCSDTL